MKISSPPVHACRNSFLRHHVSLTGHKLDRIGSTGSTRTYPSPRLLTGAEQMAQTTQITLPRFVINGSALDVIVFIYDRQTINEKRKRNNTTPRTTVPGRFLPNHDQLTLFVRRLQLTLTPELILWSVRGRHVAVLRSCFFQCSIQSVSVVFKRL